MPANLIHGQKALDVTFEALGVDVPVGALLAVGFGSRAIGITPSVTDARGNTYTYLRQEPGSTSAGGVASCAYAITIVQNALSAGDHINVGLTGEIAIAAFSGVVSPLHAYGVNATSYFLGGSLTGGSSVTATTTKDDLILGMVSSGLSGDNFGATGGAAEACGDGYGISIAYYNAAGGGTDGVSWRLATTDNAPQAVCAISAGGGLSMWM